MTAAPTLNTGKPYQWACVVSSVTWAEYKLSSSGKFTAETTRGPLIVWATKTGEGKNLPTLQPPTLSALEEQTAKLNTRAAFDRLFWAARGKVRASVRWKTPTKYRRQVVFFQRVFMSIYARYKRIGYWTLHNWKAIKKIVNRQHQRTFIKYLDEDDRPNDSTNYVYSLLFAYKERSWYEEYFLESLESKNFLEWYDLAENSLYSYNYRKELEEHGLQLLRFLLGTGGSVNKTLVYKTFEEIRCKAYKAFLDALKSAQKRIRAHLTKRVKPVTRRTRAPRPLYARPRPPTAPTAPPLLEA